jgi:rubrerythrin
VSTKSSSKNVEAGDEAASVHSLFREVNERIRGLNGEFEQLVAAGEWFCECADPTCFERLEMTQDEYDAIRLHPDRYPIIPGHEVAGVERVVQIVSRHSNYLVVEDVDVQTDTAGSASRRAKADGRTSANEAETTQARQSASPLLQLRCDGCRYGASVRGTPERCPMCGGSTWLVEGWRLWGDLISDLDPVANKALTRDSAHEMFPVIPRT